MARSATALASAAADAHEEADLIPLVVGPPLLLEMVVDDKVLICMILADQFDIQEERRRGRIGRPLST